MGGKGGETERGKRGGVDYVKEGSQEGRKE